MRVRYSLCAVLAHAGRPARAAGFHCSLGLFLRFQRRRRGEKPARPQADRACPIPKTPMSCGSCRRRRQNATKSALIAVLGRRRRHRPQRLRGSAAEWRRPPRQDADRRLRHLLHRVRAAAPGRFGGGAHDFNTLNAARPPGVLREWSLLGEAEAAERWDRTPTLPGCTRGVELKPTAPDQVLWGLARTLAYSGDKPARSAAYRQRLLRVPAERIVGRRAPADLQLRRPR